MATSVALSRSQTAFANGQVAPVFEAIPLIAENIANPTSSTQTTGTAPTGIIAVWRIATDTAIWVAFGTNPIASAGTSYFIPAGAELHVGAEPGHKVAVINA